MLLFEGKKKPHIKKPLNAFMLYMKEMRPKVTETMAMVIVMNWTKTLKDMSEDGETKNI